MKRIFTICVLFILLSVPTQAQGTLIYLPLIFKSVECKMPFPTTSILDDFNRADEGPPPSANWTTIDNGLKVVSNQVAGDDIIVSNSAYWDASTFGPNCEAYVTIATLPGDSLGVTIGCRYDVATDSGYIVLFSQNDLGDDAIYLIRLDAGAPTILDTATVEVAAGDSIGIMASGSTISAYHKPSAGSWTEIINVTDSTYTGAGYLYLAVDGLTGVADDFGGGDFASSSNGGSTGSSTEDSKCVSPMNNNWSFIQPVESTNYVLNPSAEAASNFSSLGGATITRSSTYQKYGRYSYRVQTGTNGQGLSLTLSTLTNSVHYVTARIRGQLPVSTRFIIGTGLKTPVFIEKIDDDWNLYGVQFNASESNGRTELRIIQQGNGLGDFYIDGIQVEPLAYWTTYIDGTQEGCAWNGVEHASTSTRSGLSLAGGQVKDFYEDYGFLVEKVIGGGAPSQNVNVDEYAILPGGELNSIKINPRDMSIVGKFIADNELELHDKQQALHLALSSENYPNNQSFKLRYNGARVQKEIEVNYKGGLEGDLNAFYQDRVVSGDSDWELLYKWIEKASIQFQAPDPYWYETGESAANLDGNDSATFRVVAGRLKSMGQWSALGPPNAAGTYTAIYAIAEDATYIYFGGSFTDFDNIAAADRIVRYNKLTGAYSALGSGLNNVVRALAIAPNGDLYIGGHFTNAGGVAAADYITRWDGTNFNAVGNPNAGTAAITSVRALCFDLSGNLYIGGQFTNWGNDGNADNVVMWNGLSYSALGVGANGIVYAFAVNPTNGVMAIGGAFTTIAGVAANYIALWDGSTATALGTGMDADTRALVYSSSGLLYAGGAWTLSGGIQTDGITSWNGASFSALGGGANNTVYSLALGADDTLYAGGEFTQMSGLTLADRIARWNGYAWAHLDIDLPGTPIVWSILASKYVNPVIPQKYDLFLGFDTSGTGYFAGKVSITNDGNALAFPQIVFKRTGGTVITIETLKNETTGKELLFDYDLLDGERLTIDLTPTRKSIISNYFGSRLDAVLANSDFGIWALKPGSNDVTCFTADNFALYASSLDAYLLWKDKYKSYN